MHPIIHSKSSQTHFGGCWEDYIHIHNWMDSSKVHAADCRHRHTHHTDVGIEQVLLKFGETVTLSDGGSVPTRAVATQHIKEDCGGYIPSKEDWFRELKKQSWMFSKWLSPKLRRLGCTNPLDHQNNMAKLYGGDPSDYERISQYFTPIRFIDRPYIHHSGGIFDVEEYLGVGIELSNGGLIGTRTVAEQMVKSYYGRIPTMSDWIRNVPIRSFMSKNYTLSDAEAQELSHAE